MLNHHFLQNKQVIRLHVRIMNFLCHNTIIHASWLEDGCFILIAMQEDIISLVFLLFSYYKNLQYASRTWLEDKMNKNIQTYID